MAQRQFTPTKNEQQSKKFNECFANCGPKGPFHTMFGKSFKSIFGRGRAARLTELASVSTVDLEEYRCWLRCALEETTRVTLEAAELQTVAADELMAAADANDSVRENAAAVAGNAATELSQMAIERSEVLNGLLNDIQTEEQARLLQGVAEVTDAMANAFGDGLAATTSELEELAELASSGGRRKTLNRRKRKKRRKKTKKRRRRKRKTRR